MEQRIMMAVDAVIAKYTFDDSNTSGWSGGGSIISQDSLSGEAGNDYLTDFSSTPTLELANLPTNKTIHLGFRVFVLNDGSTHTGTLTIKNGGNTIATRNFATEPSTNLNIDGTNNDFIYNLDVPFVNTVTNPASLTWELTGASASASIGLDDVSMRSVPTQMPSSSLGNNNALGTAGFITPSVGIGGFGGGMTASVTLTTNAISQIINSSSGNGTLDGWSQIIQNGGTNILTIVNKGGCNCTGAGGTQVFNSSGGGNYTGQFGILDKLTYNSTDQSNSEYTVTGSDGTITTYHDFTISPSAQQGKIKSMKDPKGNVTSFTYDGSGKLTTVERTDGTDTDQLNYDYIPSGSNAGKLADVVVEHSNGCASASVESLIFSYYDGSGTGANAYGRLGDLMSVEQTAGGTNSAVIDTTYYRYWLPGEDGFDDFGFAGALKMELSAASYARAVAESHDPLAGSVSDATLDDYADVYLKYDPTSGRVSSRSVQGEGCSSCSGGIGVSGYTYESSTFAEGMNTWKTKSTTSLADGTYQIEYYNAYGGPMLDLTEDADGKRWGTFHLYDADGREILTAMPSALALPSSLSTIEQYPDLLHAVSGNYQYMRDAAGLVETTSFYSSTSEGIGDTVAGDAAGYVHETAIQKGETGTSIKQSSTDYFAHDDGSDHTIYPVATTKRFRNTDGSGEQITSYSYGWYTDSLQAKSITTTLPAISSDQNGSNASTSDTTFFDVYGRSIWSKDAEDHVTFTDYDTATGAVIKRIVDVDYDQLSGGEQTSFDATGWSEPAGLHLVTTFEVDDKGRVTKTTDPKGNVTHTRYNDAEHEVRSYSGWKSTGSGTNTTYAPTGPVSVSRTDRAGSYSEQLTFVYSPGTNATPLGTETINASNIRSLSRSHVSNGGQLDSSDSYFTLSGLTYTTNANFGTNTSSLLHTEYQYNSRGQQSRVQTPDGTITRTLYDGLNRVTSVWKGTDDTPTTGSWTPTNTAGANLVKISENVYDNGGVGDSNLTLSRIYGDDSTTYNTINAFDWRDRLIASKNNAEIDASGNNDLVGEDTTTHRTINYQTLDNLSQVTGSYVYAADKIGIGDFSNGALASDFGSDGKITASGFSISAVATQSDGKIVAVGSSSDQNHVIIVRYNLDGTPDSTFDSDGTLSTDFQAGAYYDYVSSVVIQADGKILVGGTSGTNKYAVMRLNTDGSLDTYFGTSGRVTTSYSGFASTMRVQDDGKIVLAGTHSGHIGVIRYTSSGALDTSFDSDGKAAISVGSNDIAYDMVIQPDGKILIAGSSDSDSLLVRLNTDGGLDSSFDADGYRVLNWGTSLVESVALQPDGKIVAGGYISDGGTYLAIGRLNTDGSPDTTFDTDGLQLTSLNGDEEMTEVAVQPDGRIVGVGGTSDVSSSYAVVVRYNPDGSPDTAFDSDGIVVTPFGDYPWFTALTFVGNRIVGAGFDNTGGVSSLVMAEYDIDGTPDQPFSGFLRAKSTFDYDDQGRMYRSTVYNVDPTDGTDGHHLSTNTFYNPRGMVIKVQQPNGLFSKTSYDGAGRVTDTYLGFDDGESDYADADDVDYDTIIQQNKTIYDQAGNAVVNISYERLENDSSTEGALSSGTNPVWINVTANYFDAANRLTQTTNYGRDNGSTRYVFATNAAIIDLHDWTGGGSADGIPDEAQDTIRGANSSDDYIVGKYEYNDAGQLFKTTDNLGRSNWTLSDLLGRTTKTIENVPGTNSAQLETDTDKRRTTEYLYDSAGRMSTMRAWNPKGYGNGIQYQDTKYLYESSFDGSLVTGTIYPDSSDTDSTGTDQVKTQCDRLGRVTQTTDQNGTVHQFEYDGAGRFYADKVTTLGTNIDDAVLRIDRTYDDLGRVATITSRSGTAAASSIVNQIQLAYDGWGNVTQSWQSHSGAVDTDTTPSVQYAYDDGASGDDAKYLRLSSVTYPATNRTVFYLYGSTGGISDMLSRVESIADAATSGTDYVHYDYIGTDRIVKITHDGAGSNGLSLSYGSGGTYAGLDRFGRITQKLWKDAALSGGSYDGYVYTYDRNSNVKSKANYSTGGNPGNLDEVYSYDGLNRLLESRRGTASSNLISHPDKLTDWTLDAQGNWVDNLGVATPTAGDATTDGNVDISDWAKYAAFQGSTEDTTWRMADINGDGQVDSSDMALLAANYGSSGGSVGTLQTRTNNAANEITGVSGSWVTPTYDAAGNMVSAPINGDETHRYWYVFDAWNRIVEVKYDSSNSPGSTLATYSYDGQNRRVTKVTTGDEAATYDDYFNENWQRLETRRDGDADPLDQFLWDVTYIDTPVLRWHDANTDGDLADVSSGDPGPSYDNTLYYTTDANHNITALYDADQERVIERYVYDPYGKTYIFDRIWGAISSSAVDNDVQNSGYLIDAETGNVLARTRYKNIPLATWYERDFAGYVDGANLYQYVRSNPGRLVDPTGAVSATIAVAHEERRSLTFGTYHTKYNSGTGIYPGEAISETSDQNFFYWGATLSISGTPLSGEQGITGFTKTPKIEFQKRNVEPTGQVKPLHGWIAKDADLEDISKLSPLPAPSKNLCTEVWGIFQSFKIDEDKFHQTPKLSAFGWIGNMVIDYDSERGIDGFGATLDLGHVAGVGVGVSAPPPSDAALTGPGAGDFFLGVMIAANGHRRVWGGPFQTAAYDEDLQRPTHDLNNWHIMHSSFSQVRNSTHIGSSPGGSTNSMLMTFTPGLYTASD